MGTRGTTNHVFFLDEILGTGSSASVYVGRNRKSGQLCAVKVYSSWNYTQTREFQTMKMLSHENIIKFISIEPETNSKENVLIMELSAGGSVLNMLEKPEYALGFPEEEFLVFLKDITSALRYLRENRVVHRDIKPGNILRFLREDMSSQYKLTDFGAARELDDSDQFTSIYGTEEYLEPGVYHHALLSNSKAPKKFDASIDLWSLGVTLYHVATGQLPFQPYGGRKNKEDMFLITSKKSRGIISGIQKEQDGLIIWSGDLPDTCLLSRSLKIVLTTILVGLLEIDSKCRWIFDDFFCMSTEITSKKVFHVLYVCDFVADRIYINPDDVNSPVGLLTTLAQKYKCNDVDFIHLYLSKDEILDNPKSISSSQPLFVFPASSPVDKYWKSFSNRLPLEVPEVIPTRSMSCDYKFSHKSLSFVSFLRRKAEIMIELIEHLDRFSSIIVKDMESLSLKFLDVSNIFKLLHSNEVTPPTQNGRSHKIVIDQLDHRPSRIILTEAMVLWMKRFQAADNLKIKKFAFANEIRPCKERTTKSEINKFSKIYTELSGISEKFYRQSLSESKNESKLTHNEHEIHKFDKKRIVNLNIAAMELYIRLAKDVESILNHFKVWFRECMDKRDRLDVLQSQMSLNVTTCQNNMERQPKILSRYKSSTTYKVRYNHNLFASSDDIKNDILERLDDFSRNEEELSSKNSQMLSLLGDLQLSLR